MYLTNNANLSLTLVTIVRNCLVVFMSTHISGCLFYYIARQAGDNPSWLASTREWIPPGVGTFEEYIFSL